MKRGKLINRGIAAVLTFVFMALVRPDPAPTVLGLTITTILMYEGLQYAIGYIRAINRKRKGNKYITLTRQDMRRWADEWITPSIREVS